MMTAYAEAQKWTKEECERLRGEGDQFKFIDLRFERWQVVGKAIMYLLCIFVAVKYIKFSFG